MTVRDRRMVGPALLLLPFLLGACTAATPSAAVTTTRAASQTPLPVGSETLPPTEATATSTEAAASTKPPSTPAPPPRASDTPTPFPITLDISPSPTPEPFPFVAIQVLSPGPLSRLSTPIRLSAVLVPGAGGKVRSELLGEDGRLLTREITQHTANPNQRINLNTDLDFEIEAVAETGTLVVSVDDEFGRTTALTSVEIILLSAGPSDINPEGDLLAPVAILEPEPNTLAEGGELLVSGLARPISEQPLILELVTQDGNVVGSRQAAVEEGPPGEHRFFSAVIPYTVSEPTQALLIIRERNDRFAGNSYILSQKIVLAP